MKCDRFYDLISQDDINKQEERTTCMARLAARLIEMFPSNVSGEGVSPQFFGSRYLSRYPMKSSK
jgi:hypothetical protein